MRCRRAVEAAHVTALVVHGPFEGAARARRGLLEDQRDVLALEARAFVACGLGAPGFRRQVDQVADLARREALARIRGGLTQGVSWGFRDRKEWRVPLNAG
jgi:hypothetical protein